MDARSMEARAIVKVKVRLGLWLAGFELDCHPGFCPKSNMAAVIPLKGGVGTYECKTKTV